MTWHSSSSCGFYRSCSRTGATIQSCYMHAHICSMHFHIQKTRSISAMPNIAAAPLVARSHFGELQDFLLQGDSNHAHSIMLHLSRKVGKKYGNLSWAECLAASDLRMSAHPNDRLDKVTARKVRAWLRWLVELVCFWPASSESKRM